MLADAIELINKSEVKEGAKAQLKIENDRLHAKVLLLSALTS